VAGKQKGKADDRYLWPEMLRVIRELAPSWVIGENVPGILSIAADDVCKDLESQGYEVGIFNYEAAAVGAVHRRERVFFVANANSSIGDTRRTEPKGQQGETWFTNGRDDVANTKHEGRNSRSGNIKRRPIYDRSERIVSEDQPEGNKRKCGAGENGSNVADTDGKVSRYGDHGNEEIFRNPKETRWDKIQPKQCWSIEPDVGRVANGISHRVDRLKCLGNAVVPQQVYPILKAIAEIEAMK
jgi:DNA (cytosine-5)-methyltransferase 1